VSSVSIHGLSKHFGGKTPTTAIDDLNLEIELGEFLVLLGPSGCGKTTTLRCIAGLETADAGSIAFGDNTVFDAARHVDVPPNKRNIGMVFQSYALWPHMTVSKNIGYPLRARKIKGKQATEWVEEVARLVDTKELLDR
jgi:iron(III) transport system ATP-binding protein